MTMLQGLPKVSLHCHLEGTLRPATYRELAQHYAIDLGERTHRPDEELYAFSSFHEFLWCFRHACLTLRHPADYGRLAQEYADDAVRDGVAYAELFVAPAVWRRLHPELDVRAAFEAIRNALQAAEEANGIRVALICDITRNFGVEQAEDTLEIALAMRDLGVIGIGLGGDEVAYPAEWFAAVFARAQRRGLRCVAHAGEAAGPESVRAAVELLGAERIGHGVRALEDPAVVHLLRQRQVTLEQAPTSNRRTGIVQGQHPLHKFVAAGVRVALDADDPALFASSILEEYVLVAAQHGLSFILDRAYDAIAGSFAERTLRNHLFDQLAAYDRKWRLSAPLPVSP